MLSLSAAAVLEKNKLSSTGAWPILLDIDFRGSVTLRVALNNEDITWPSTDGELYQAFPFEIDEIREDSMGTLPTFAIKVSNVTRALVPYIEESDGGKGTIVTLRVVHSDHLDLTTPELEEVFTVIKTSIDERWVTFTMGAENPMLMRSPKDRYLKDHCRFKFKSTICGYTGTASACDKTFRRCRALGNSTRYGGFPGIDGGVYV